MRAVVLEVDHSMLAERRRLGRDRHDEMWEGTLHMVPPPSYRHQEIEAALVAALRPNLVRLGYSTTAETGVFASDDDYRVPDVVVCRRQAASERGIDGPPALVVEIRSPGDESDAKLPWYLERGASAVLVIDRDTLAVSLYGSDGPVPQDGDGLVTIGDLGIRIGNAGPATLVIEDAAGRSEVEL